MDNIMLSQILEKICVEEAAGITAAPVPELSYRHGRKMKKIFSRYQKSLHSLGKPRVRGVKKVVLAVMIILLAALTVTAGAMAVNGFDRKKYHDYTVLFAVNAENCPQTIENVYYLPEIPDGYEPYEFDSNYRSVYTAYRESDTNRMMVFSQRVKYGYKVNFNTEYGDFEELSINGHYALYLDNSNSEQRLGCIVWDNGDYILEISGNFTKDQLVLLAESAKI